MTNKYSDTDLREYWQPIFDYVLELDEERQELWMRLFDLCARSTRTEQETEEFEALLSKLRLADAERSGDPILQATLVAAELAYKEAFKKADQAELSYLGVQIAAATAQLKAQGETPSEAEELVRDAYLGAQSADGSGRVNSRNILEAIDEVHRAGLWPWKGMN